jgi:hypothetical protein
VPATIDLADKSRYRITNVVLSLLVGGIATAMVLLIMEGAGICFGQQCDYSSVISQVLDVLKTIILPLTTLVFGHYLGRRSE